MDNLPEEIRNVLLRIDRWFHKKLRFIVLPGFEGMPLYDVLSFFFQGLFKGVLTYRAAAIAFNFFLALVPFILFLFTLIPFVTNEDLQADLLGLMDELIPAEIFDIFESTMVEIISRPSTGLLSLVFIMAVYFATNGIDAVLDGFGQSYHDIDVYSWWKQKLAAFLMMTGLSLMIIVAMTLLAFGKVTIYFLSDQGLFTAQATILFLRLLQWLIIILITLTSISILYFFGQPKDRQQNEYRFFSPGSILGTTLFVLGGLLIKMYFENFARYNLLYGSVGSVIILLIWLYYNAIILLIGFELNASIQQSKAKKSSYRIIE